MKNTMKNTHLPIRRANRFRYQTKLAAALGLMGSIRTTCFVFLSLLLAFLVGCSPIATPPHEGPTVQPTIETRMAVTPVPTETGSSPNPTENQKEVIVTEPPAEAASYDPALEPLVTIALEDLSDRLNVDIGQIVVIEAELVTWPDASLGCPQPGMVYAQVPVDGTLIRLEVAGKVYEYHGGGWIDPFLCEQVIKTKPTSPQIDLLKITPPPSDTEDQ